jgi:hypothetical protein
MTDYTPTTLRALAQGINPREMDFPEGASTLRSSLIRLADALSAHADAWQAREAEFKTLAYHEGYRAGIQAERDRISKAIETLRGGSR